MAELKQFVDVSHAWINLGHFGSFLLFQSGKESEKCVLLGGGIRVGVESKLCNPLQLRWDTATLPSVSPLFARDS